MCIINPIDMSTVTISPKFQLVFPKNTRDGLSLLLGYKVLVIQLECRIELVPVRLFVFIRGFLKSLENNFEREGG